MLLIYSTFTTNASSQKTFNVKTDTAEQHIFLVICSMCLCSVCSVCLCAGGCALQQTNDIQSFLAALILRWISCSFNPEMES